MSIDDQDAKVDFVSSANNVFISWRDQNQTCYNDYQGSVFHDDFWECWNYCLSSSHFPFAKILASDFLGAKPQGLTNESIIEMSSLATKGAVVNPNIHFIVIMDDEWVFAEFRQWLAYADKSKWQFHVVNSLNEYEKLRDNLLND